MDYICVAQGFFALTNRAFSADPTPSGSGSFSVFRAAAIATTAQWLVTAMENLARLSIYDLLAVMDEVFTEHAGYRLIWSAETEAFGTGPQEEFPFFGLQPVVKSESKTRGSRQ